MQNTKVKILERKERLERMERIVVETPHGASPSININEESSNRANGADRMQRKRGKDEKRISVTREGVVGIEGVEGVGRDSRSGPK